MKIHHLGILTNNIDNTIEIYKKLGFKFIKKINDSKREIIIAFMIAETGEKIELIYPINNSNKYSSLQKRYRNSIYHICYEVNDIKLKINELIKYGFVIIEEPAVASAINQQKVAFLYSHQVGIIELLELKR